ncbi:MAG: GDSL-type esterase/lipase family protein [Bryobacteraceae bacterium]
MRLAVGLVMPALLLAQAVQPPTPSQFPKHIDRGAQLMESVSVAIPDMIRAGAPLVEIAKQAKRSYESPDIRTDDSRVLLGYINALRVFLMLTEALPKPIPFPAEADRQLAELRVNYSLAESALRLVLDSKEATTLGADWDEYKRYAEANRNVPAPATPNGRVVFLGDSITDGWRLNEYFPDRDFVNRGISGQITGQMLGRMKADVIDLKPAAVFILAGTNDIARGVPDLAIQHHLTMIADLAEAHKIKPIFASVLPISDYHKTVNPRYEMSRMRPPARVVALNNWLRTFCQTRGYTYADYFAALADAKGFLKPEYADDGLHPNGSGYRLMAPVAYDAINKALPQTAPAVRRRK